MKRLLILFLLLSLMLCACGETPLFGEAPGENGTPAVTPTEPGGSYQPDSETELATAGAVRAHPLQIPNTYAAVVMGDHVVVFSGMESTTLTRLSGENLYVTASAQLDQLILPDSADVQITDRGIVYYSRETGELVYLDPKLAETGRKAMPADLVGLPVLSSDRRSVYYCTAEGLRCLDLDQNLSRLLKQFSYTEQSVTGVLLGGSVIRCQVRDGEEYRDIFLSAENGQTLTESSDLILTTREDRYYAIVPGRTMQSFVFGTAGEMPQMLVPARFDAFGWFLEDRHQFVSGSMDPQTHTLILEQYDLSDGKRLARVSLPDCGYPWSVAHRGVGEQIYLLCEDPSGSGAILYRWDAELTAMEDTAVYSGPYYNQDSPDLEGLAACESLASDIGQRHGVRILVGEPAAEQEPWDYDLTPEYHVPVLMRELTELDTYLKNYPQGFLAATAEGTGSGCITICLVAEITGSPEAGSLDSVEGLEFRVDENIYLALKTGSDLERQLYHEIYHALETRLLSSSNDCYQWDSLNPGKFQYDYDYAANAQRTEDRYLEGKDRYFIDTYSMSFPKEDRARIMEYAMLEGNAEYFQSAPMQKKLRTLCSGIREAYGLKEFPEPFLWEQYLNKPLAPKS